MYVLIILLKTACVQSDLGNTYFSLICKDFLIMELRQ